MEAVALSQSEKEVGTWVIAVARTAVGTGTLW